jgi:RNA polymerase sigma factor for flagellar operon FliA
VNGESNFPSGNDLNLVSAVVQRVARAHFLSPADAEDFAQVVQLRLVERDYDILRRFAGRSSLRTYLTVVVTRMFLDWRNATYGKWRPSAAAKRLGEHAVRLERLIHRDGFTPDEAIQTIGNSPNAPPLATLHALADELPRRIKRRHVSDDALQHVAGHEFEDPVEAAESVASRHRVARALVETLQQLPADEQQLLQMRYVRRLPIKTIASLLHVDPKDVHRRFDSVFRRLRRRLLRRGITGASPAV